MRSAEYNIAVIGLGYVGAPLAIEFAKKYSVVGFDIDNARVTELNGRIDRTKEVDVTELDIVLNGSSITGTGLLITSDIADIKSCNIYVVTVPTPIDEFKAPDLSNLKNASDMLGKLLKRGDLVVYESTVYPGCTEEVCIPILESSSNMVLNDDFHVGYSPERVNPGDKVRTLTQIKKVTSGSNPVAADIVDRLYASVITAGTHKAPNIKVAEASKAVENAQRDINISFMNELALIFDRIGIDTNDVLDAAATKWNFLRYKPGLVGGHCIGVDPYYLAHKAMSVGYYPEVMLSGRRINDNMGRFVADKVVKLMINKGHVIKGSRVLILGVTFKEDCPDIRNTKVVDIYTELNKLDVAVDVYDPWANADNVKTECGIDLIPRVNTVYDAVILAVAHKQFADLNYSEIANERTVIYDTKAFLSKAIIDGRL